MREGGREGGREGEIEGGREGLKERERKGGREGGRERVTEGDVREKRWETQGERYTHPLHTLYRYKLTILEYNILRRDDSFNIKYQCQ